MQRSPEIQEVFQALKTGCPSYPSLEERMADLDRLRKAVEERSGELLAALHSDLGKPEAEAYASEIGFVIRDIDFARRHLKYWMKPRRASVPWMAWPGRASVQCEPLGCVLIVGPWNYPFQLLLSPFVSALAAGNRVCLKPSEYAPATADAVAGLVEDCFPAGQVAVVRGEAGVAAELCGLPFDHIFFTGSTETGRKVATAAAENLVPVTLELGGKSPCVVCADAPIETTARRIMWGKCLNAGQTCVAPDYVLAHSSIIDPLLAALRDTGEVFVPGLDSPDYGRIINERHFDRLLGLMEGHKPWSGGAHDRKKLKIAPTILAPAGWDSKVMQEEIFGPLLPVLPFDDMEALLGRLKSMPRPLAAYLFTGDKTVKRGFIRRLSAGGICVNDTIMHIMPPDLSFGGVGESGHGRSRGLAGFDSFSNPKAVMSRGFWPDPSFRYKAGQVSVDLLKKVYRWLMG